MSRILCIADTHCGHRAGLTPAGYQWDIIEEPSGIAEIHRTKYAILQRKIWEWYTNKIAELKPIDYVFHLGDCIDGRDEKATEELVVADQNQQVAMAVRCIREAEAREVYMVYGTPFHVSYGYNDWEDAVAEDVDAVKIGSHEFIDVDGKVFNLRHRVGKSSIPYGQGTLLAKQRTWNLEWYDAGIQPRADIVLRAHTHDYSVIQRENWIAMSLPGLEWSTKFGARLVDGIVNIGIVHFDIVDENVSWKHHNCLLAEMKTEVIKAGGRTPGREAGMAS